MTPFAVIITDCFVVRNRRVIMCIMLLFSILRIEAVGKWAVGDLVDPYTQDSTCYVLDDLGYLSAGSRDSINEICAALRIDADLETAVVLLDELDGDVFDFACELYEHWGLGKNDRGLLLLLVMEQHDWRFVTGYGAEADLPDALLGNIGNDIMVPYMRDGDYGGGICAGLEDIYLVLTDEEYKSGTYGVVYDAENDSLENQSYGYVLTNNDSNCDNGWGDAMLEIWIVIFIFGGTVMSIYKSSKGSLSSIKAEKVSKVVSENQYGEIRLGLNKNYKDWSVWNSGAGCLRFLVVDFGFIIVVMMAYDGGGLMVLVGLLFYLTVIAVVWRLTAMYKMKKSNDLLQKYAHTKAMMDSGPMKLFRWIAPHIAGPYYVHLEESQENQGKELLRCPICEGELKKSEETRYRPSGVGLYEVEHDIMKCEMHECAEGHTVGVYMPGKSYFKYVKTCDNCGGHTCTKSVRVTKDPTYSETGEKIVTYKCEYCNTEKEQLELISILTRSSSGGGGGYSSGGYSGGGSRGGGRSGGGGAGGRW